MDHVEHTATAGTIAGRIEAMARGRELEKIARSLERKVPAAAAHADDAVANAVVCILELASPPDPGRLGSYLYRAAVNDMVDHVKASRRLKLKGGSLYDDEHEADESFEEGVLGEIEFQRIRAQVETWTNRNIRAVTLAAIDAAYRGVTLTVDELTEDASAIRGEALSRESVARWKTRGFRRLRAELAPDVDIQIPEEPT